MDLSTEESAEVFNFNHKIFKIPGNRFALSASDHQPVLLMDVGEHAAAITFEALHQEFNLDPEGEDSKLLDLVAQGLKYVRDIRPGDTIPRELLDGSASWSVEDRHRERAKNGFMFRIALLGAPNGGITKAPDNLGAFLESSDGKMFVQSGLDLIGQKIGLGEGRAPTVAQHADQIMRELAYIEGLRERYVHVSRIVDKLDQVAQHHSSERHFVDEIQRCKVLMGPPVKNFRDAFHDVDTRMKQVAETLKAVDEQVVFIRETRDRLHQKMLIWDELIEKWDFKIEGKSKHNRQMVQMTYQFVAQYFRRMSTGCSAPPSPPRRPTPRPLPFRAASTTLHGEPTTSLNAYREAPR